MQDIVASLDTCVQSATFALRDLKPIGWHQYRQLFCKRQWGDSTWLYLAGAKLHTDPRHVADLVTKLQPLLDEFTNDTGRLGNGLFLLLGGSREWAYPTVEEFAKTLIVAAARTNATDVTRQLLAWAGGESLRYQECSLLSGVDIDADLEMVPGVRLKKLPASSADIPVSIPSFGHVTMLDLMGGIVLTIDCESRPALYRPDEKEMQQDPPSRTITRASESIQNFSLDTLCQSLGLTANGYIDYYMIWKDFESLAAFVSLPSSVSTKMRQGFGNTKIFPTHLKDALTIHQDLYGSGNPPESLGLAIDRWIRSKRTSSDIDKLIELRIALEALYYIGGASEKRFRIATYAAWYLGKDLQDRARIHDTLSKVYKASSAVIHGGKSNLRSKHPDLVPRTEDICRNGILKRLKTSTEPDWDKMILGGG